MLKIFPVILAFTSVLLLPVISFAQTGGTGPVPCDPNGIPGDPGDGNDCPLDTWVIILAVLAVIFAAIYLHRKQKSLQPEAKGI